MLLTQENEVRLSRATRGNTASAGPAGTIEVKIHTPIGQVKRKFCEGGLYQVNNNILSNDKSCKNARLHNGNNQTFENKTEYLSYKVSFQVFQVFFTSTFLSFLWMNEVLIWNNVKK